MKVVKSLLLGSAAGVVAVAGTQAADLPVKARPVEYVKICSLYGAGFYYIPGSDVCLKIGGYIRSDYGFNVRGARTPSYSGAEGRQSRETSAYSTRHRAHFNFDSRTQTAYGTLRTYAAIHIDNQDQGTVTVNPTRAFIQWAGFTFGHTKSFTDVPGTMGDDTFKTLHQNQIHSDSGANGTNQIAYTWELGNGMTLNVGADERRQKAIANLSTVTFAPGSDPTSSAAGQNTPNPWVNFAVNQAWGRFGASFIGNSVRSTYYGSTTTTGYPDDKWGWAFLSGIDIKAPWLGPGDHFGGYFSIGRGALAYAAGSNLASPGLYGANNSIAFGVVTDSVYINDGQQELTSAWTVGAGWEHFWLPNFSTTFYGARSEISYNDTVVKSAIFCGPNGIQVDAPCDPSFKYWMVGSHTDWYPVPGFRLAVEVQYTRIETAFDGKTVALPKAGTRPAGNYTAGDDGIISAIFRAQRSFASGD
jgi:hypothetical protein